MSVERGSSLFHVKPRERRGGVSSRRLWDLPLQAAPERMRVSLRFETAPPEGPVQAPHVWDDLLHHGAPWHGPRPPPTWCVPGPEMFEGGLRIELPLLVTATDAGPVLEDRVSVTGRVLAGAIETERARMGAFVQQAASRTEDIKHRGVQKGRALRRRGGPVALVGALLAWLARIFHRVAEASLRGLRGLTRGTASTPDRLRVGWTRATTFLATPTGRKRFREGLMDPRNLSPAQKAVTLFTGVGIIVASLIVLHFAVTLIIPQHAVAWRRVFLLFVYAFITSLGPPLPLEPILLGASIYVGPLVTLAIVVTAKVLAAWMVFFLGDEVNDKLREQSQTKPWIGRMLDWSEAFARRFGVFALATFIAVPGLPDVIALYLFGTLQMTLPKFLAGVFVGSLILNTIILYGVGSLLGLH